MNTLKNIGISIGLTLLVFVAIETLETGYGFIEEQICSFQYDVMGHYTEVIQNDDGSTFKVVHVKPSPKR